MTREDDQITVEWQEVVGTCLYLVALYSSGQSAPTFWHLVVREAKGTLKATVMSISFITLGIYCESFHSSAVFSLTFGL